VSAVVLDLLVVAILAGQNSSVYILVVGILLHLLPPKDVSLAVALSSTFDRMDVFFELLYGKLSCTVTVVIMSLCQR
jgi:hypothetical protein